MSERKGVMNLLPLEIKFSGEIKEFHMPIWFRK